MKRSREEGSTVPQVKRPNAPRGDPCGETSMPPTATGSVDRRLTTNDALAYLKDVKGIFKDKKEKYDEFLEVMKDFKAQRIDTAGVIQRVKELFRGHRDLILGFNAFLPQGYEITMPNEEEIQQKKPVEFEEAMNFVNKIKTCFQNDERIYKTFLDILNMYRKESKSIAEVYQEVTLLFENHHDLLKEFTYFLPNHTGKSMLQERTSVHRHGQVDKTDNAHSDRDLCDRPGEAHQRHRKRAEKEKHKSEDKDRINHENDGKDLGRDSRDENMRRKRKSCQRVNYRVVEPMHTSGENTENFGIYSASDATHNNKNALKNESEKQFTFIERVKEKLNGDAYQEFLKYLHLYSKEMISRTELKKLVGDCLRSYPGLVDGIIKFLPSCESIESSLKGHFGGPVIMDRREKERESENEREKDRDNAKEINKERETPKDSADHKASSLAGEMCSWNKPISELDLSDCQRCTPSYRLLPKNYPLPPSTNRTEVGDAVLNDLWVSVTSGSEDYSFKHMRKNQYEESLFRCEDDRFELDMLLESVNTTTKRVEDLLKAMQDDLIKQESQIRLEDHFNALNLRCIERLYGDHGLDVMDVLRKNPGLALPVILTRLKQKQEEWSKCRADFNKVWAEIYAKNYHKSLDHRSFYFKQQDAKNLSTKVLLTEIKEVNEKKEKEDDILSAVSAGSRAAIPHMEFDYNDPNIHEDIYEIINYSCGEVCSSTDQMDKVLEIWTTFLEPMLGVPPRLLGPQDETKKQTVKSSFAAPGESCRISDVVAPSGNLQLNLFGGGSGSKRLEEASSFRRRLARDTIDCDAVDVHRAPCRTDKVCATSSCEKMPDDLLTSGDALGIGMRSVLTKQAADASATHFKHDQDVPEEAIVAQTNNEVLTSAFEENTKADRLREGHSIHGVGGEREEGELPPAPDFEESNLEPMKEGTAEPHCLDRGGADDADTDNEGKESAQRSIEGSENASDAAEDALASDSGNGELCSQEGQGADEDAKHADHDGNTESEDEAEGIADARGTEGDGQSLTLHEHFPHTAKPLAKHVPRALFDVEKCSRIFYGNDSFYVLFRLHQTLYERILSAKVNSSSAERKWGSSKESNRPGLYTKFMGALFSLLNGSADNTKFEDDCRSIIGTQSYVLFTLDKLIYKLVKQVRAIASDEMDNRLLQLYAYESSRRPGQFIDLAYQENAHVILNDDVIYRFECSSDPTPTHLSIQLVECGHEKSEMAAVSLSPNFASYLYNDFLSVIPSGRKTHSVFLRRNKRKNAGDDPYAATPRGSELTFLVNGLECKISCKSLKVSYVLDTEDLFYCKKRRISSHTSSSSAHDRVNSAPSVRVQSFHQFLSS